MIALSTVRVSACGITRYGSMRITIVESYTRRTVKHGYLASNTVA